MQTWDLQNLAGRGDGRGYLAAMSWHAIDGCFVGCFVERFERKFAKKQKRLPTHRKFARQRLWVRSHVTLADLCIHTKPQR